MSRPDPSDSPFPTDVYKGLSHGTLECHEIVGARPFYSEVLGLQTLRYAPPAFATWRNDWSFFIASIESGDQVHEQHRDNRWEISVGTPQEVASAHALLAQNMDDLGLRRIEPLGEQDGFPWFCLQDRDGNWWGVSNRSLEWMEAKFQEPGA